MLTSVTTQCRGEKFRNQTFFFLDLLCEKHDINKLTICNVLLRKVVKFTSAIHVTTYILFV